MVQREKGGGCENTERCAKGAPIWAKGMQSCTARSHSQSLVSNI